MNQNCPVCGSKDHNDFFSLPQMPVSIGVQWPSASEARSCGKGDLELSFCNDCGFIWNKAFDESKLEYSQKYDNSLDYSPVFKDYAQGLASRIVETYDIREKQVVELGCGKGHFLSLLCEKGNNSGVGFDPSYEGERFDSPASDRIEYIQDFYSEKYTDRSGELVCCRHVLEHIKSPLDFLQSTRKTVGGNADTIVYFEVPNVRLILEKLSIWDIIYEHCNYFSVESLSYLFTKSGFQVVSAEESYQKQFISLEAKLASEDASTPTNLDALKLLIADFTSQMERRMEFWKTKLASLKAESKKVVIWGAGAKTVGFVNMLQIQDQISMAVDINPHKQGLHLAGTGQKIVAPEALIEEKPDVVILMNPIYKNEVTASLKELGVDADLIDA